MDWRVTALLVLAGVVTGAINAIAGGGSLMTFPALLWAGMSPIVASVTNSVSVAFGYMGSVAGSRADLLGQGPRLRRLVPAAAAGTAVGCALLLGTPAKAFDWIAPFLVLGASVLMAFQSKLQRMTGEPESHPRWAAPLSVFAIGLYGGYFIAALGVVIMSVLGLVVRDEMRKIVAAKNALQLSVGATAAIAYALFGPVNWHAVAAIVPGTLLGGYLGTHLGNRIKPATLRKVVVFFGLVVSAILLVRAF